MSTFTRRRPPGTPSAVRRTRNVKTDLAPTPGRAGRAEEGGKMTNVTMAKNARTDWDDSTFELPSLQGLRVLVVDDDADARDAVRAVLEDSGAEVIAFSSASEALSEIKNVRPDVLVSDIAMPGMDGHKLMRRIRALD